MSQVEDAAKEDYDAVNLDISEDPEEVVRQDAIEKRLKFEARGIERVLPQDRNHRLSFDNFTMWLSANLCVSTFSLGTLGIGFLGLGFYDSLAVILCFNVLGLLPVAFFSTLGPKFGLRQMTLSRFTFGWVGAIIIAFFNVLACIGWSAVNVIVGGQIINALSDGAIPIYGGIIILAFVTTLVSVYGYKIVHTYERFSWLPMLIIFIIILGQGGPYFTITPITLRGVDEVAGVLSFGGAVYGFGTGWVSYAADYNVNQPEDISGLSVFLWTFFGLFIPLVLIELLGMAFVASLANNAAWNTAYIDNSIGGLLSAVVAPLGGFGKFILFILAFSVVANNIPNDYSLGLSIQVFGKWFQWVKRYIWTFIGMVIYITIALVGSANFSTTLSSFLLLIAYWLGPYTIIMVIDYFVFRRGVYNVHQWDKPYELPVGWAAIIGMCCGVAGAIVGMDQFYWTGPIAHSIGPGTDIGFELAVGFAAVAYLILRPLEKRIHGR